MKKIHKIIYDTQRSGHCCSFDWKTEMNSRRGPRSAEMKLPKS
jgi:hypothetical protein